MTEKLLQFIWQFQYFNNKILFTEDGQSIIIIQPGKLNTQQGPDFSEAKIKLNNIIWAGNIELHVKASDWLLHQHSSDKNYDNIILHVVWVNDEVIKDNSNTPLITLELQPHVSSLLLRHYETLMLNQKAIPCENHLPVLSEISWLAWKERLAVERLSAKAKAVEQLLKNNNNNWEETFWQLLAKAFGMKTNAETFLSVAQTLPVTLLAKHKNQLHQLEVLLLGQAGLLNEQIKNDDYFILLQKEYNYLSKKYNLKPVYQPPVFLRMRPANFPTIRLSQLAALIHQSSHLFSKIKEASSVNDVMQWFLVTANDYWHYHYTFQVHSSFKQKVTGKAFIQNILINTIIPALFTYGIFYKDENIKQKAMQWLADLPSETNTIISLWQQHKVVSKNSMESQALIQLKNVYCNYKKCLDCSVGNKLLKRDAVTS